MATEDRRSLVESIIEVFEDLIPEQARLAPEIRRSLGHALNEVVDRAGVQESTASADLGIMSYQKEARTPEGPFDLAGHQVHPEDVERYRDLGAPDWLVERLLSKLPGASSACYTS